MCPHSGEGKWSKVGKIKIKLGSGDVHLNVSWKAEEFEASWEIRPGAWGEAGGDIKTWALLAYGCCGGVNEITQQGT